MKIYQLDPEEEDISKAFGEGKLVRVKNFESVLHKFANRETGSSL